MPYRLTVKKTYQDFIAPESIWPINEKLAEVVKSYKPESIFEFGCGTAKHFPLIGARESFGIDVSPASVDKAQSLKRNVLVGDETALPAMNDNRFDVVFTCSCLNHIPPSTEQEGDIRDITDQLKRIAKKAVVLAESQDEFESNYFTHDYARLGFFKLPYEWVSFYKGVRYNIWFWEKK